ncbi:MAG: YihA family ribosome biogenesis GTP-binding protein [Bacilli bacterium]|nr:YihA family ribosome biogenesis GTP-binding protein [Bacilli bacterium]
MALKNVKFVTSAADKSQWIKDDKKEFVLLGRSNVGKSTFINLITNVTQLARVSSTPGRTRLLNFFDVNNEFRLVDAPGYGYASVNKNNDFLFAKMMEDYFNDRENLVAAFLLLDSRRIPNDDDQMLFHTLFDANIPVILVATKCDKLNQSERSKLRKNIMTTLKLPLDYPLITSQTNRQNWITQVEEVIYEYLNK